MDTQKILTVELSHRKAELSVRQELAFDTESLRGLYRQLEDQYEEMFILSTCNRLAFYFIGITTKNIVHFFQERGIEKRQLIIHESDRSSASHLFKTACGIESQIIGEQQILGQIKRSLQIAQQQKSIGPILNEFIREAIGVGKKVRNQTGINLHSTSAATVGFDLINRAIGDLKNKVVLIIGTGKIASIALSIIKKTGSGKLIVASHDPVRALRVANRLGIKAISVDQINQLFNEVDVVFGGTHKEIKFWNDQMLDNNKCPKDSLGILCDRNRIFIDLGVPRNFNPELKKLPTVTLYDMDDIGQLQEKALGKRIQLKPQAEILINQYVEKYLERLNNRRLAPLYEAYWQQLESIKQLNLEWLKPKLQGTTDKQWELLERFPHKLIRQVGKNPMANIRSKVANHQLNSRTINTLAELHNFTIAEESLGTSINNYKSLLNQNSK